MNAQCWGETVHLSVKYGLCHHLQEHSLQDSTVFGALWECLLKLDSVAGNPENPFKLQVHCLATWLRQPSLSISNCVKCDGDKVLFWSMTHLELTGSSKPWIVQVISTKNNSWYTGSDTFNCCWKRSQRRRGEKMLAWVTVTTKNQETDWPTLTTPLSDCSDLLKRGGPKSA